MDNIEILTVEESGDRIDALLARNLPQFSRSQIQKLLEQGSVSIDGAPLKKNYRCSAGDCITIVLPDLQDIPLIPQNIPLDIVFEDEDVVVVNKARGMVVHPAPGHPDGTLVNALLYHCGDSLSGIGGERRPGIVHRIDKDTSGLLIVAKNDTAHMKLAAQIKEHSFRREYRAVVIGKMPAEKGTINAPLGRSRSDRKKQAVNGLNPRNAVTHYEVLERYPGYDYCRFVLETGRTHQIRVHTASVGHPVAGDSVYGPEKNNLGLEGQCLHAAVIGFVHPVTNEYMEFSAALPDYFNSVLKQINK